MSLTGLLKQSREATFRIKTREEQVREDKKWTDADLFHEKVVRRHVQSGGTVIDRRVSNFQIVADFRRGELRSAIKDWDILESVNPE
jgi:hypothetical protein